MPEPVNPTRGNTDQEHHLSAAGNLDETAAVPHGHPLPRLVASAELTTVGPYRILKQLGRGGMGAVYLALDTRLDRKVALKVMLAELAADTDAKDRFLREARAAAKISHDNVVTVFEADERGGIPYISMQFLQGVPLDEYLRTKGPPAISHVLRIAREAALGLSAAHALGLVHRDIKPANLWLEAPNGRVKVLDFGLAKPVGTDAELTKSGAVMGTPAYMSPEQARSHKVDHRTDLFSLGAVMYRLCTGQTPFNGPNVMAVLMALGSDDPTPVRELNPNLPEALAALIHQLLAKKASDRPQTATEVAKRLRAILEQLAVPAAASKSTAMEATPADLSTSQPVVVHPLPMQPPIVVPMHISAQPESAFADLDENDAPEGNSQPPRTEPKPARKKSGGKGPLIAAGVAALLALVVGAVVIAMMNKGKPEPDVKAPEAPPGDKGGKPGPKVEPKPADPLPLAYKNGTGIEFVKVPKGTGWLGGGAGKEGDTKVVFDQDFYLGKYEVTQEEWTAVMGTNPSFYSRTGGGQGAVKDITDADLKRFPVEGTTWDDCQEFIKKLNEKEKEAGWLYRMPTEAEWEYACRGGPVSKADSAFDYYFAKPTNTLRPDQANFQPAEGEGLMRTCKVGSYPPNVLGLHDMHGNIHERCDDRLTDAGGPQRAARGGTAISLFTDCRASFRSLAPPAFPLGFLSLRVARVPVAADPISPTFKNSAGIEFVKVPKAADGAPDNGSKVAFDYDFYLGKFEVTQEEWEKVVGTNPSWFSRTGKSQDAVKDIKDADLKRFPVENVSWDDCQVFLKKLNEQEKETDWVYRLPTSAEWGYACRGGPVDKADTAFKFYFAKPTNTLLQTQANFQPAEGKGVGRPCPVGSYPPNRLGLHDMQGNVWEWCQDTVQQLGTSYRTTTSGGWMNEQGACTAENRYLSEPSSRSHLNGFRVARVPAVKDRAVGAADPDRKAAEYLLSISSNATIKDVSGGKVVTAAKDLPPGPFSVTIAYLPGNKKVTDAGLVNFKGCENVTNLDLSDTQVSDTGLAVFKDCKNLFYLCLNFTQVSDAGLTNFKDRKNLVHIYLARTQLTDNGLANFKDCKSLTTLSLSGTKVTDAGLANFKGCANLTGIDVSETRVTDEGLAHFADCKALTSIDLRKTKVTAPGVAKFAKTLPKCKIEWDSGTVEPKS